MMTLYDITSYADFNDGQSIIADLHGFTMVEIVLLFNKLGVGTSDHHTLTLRKKKYQWIEDTHKGSIKWSNPDGTHKEERAIDILNAMNNFIKEK